MLDIVVGHLLKDRAMAVVVVVLVLIVVVLFAIVAGLVVLVGGDGGSTARHPHPVYGHDDVIFLQH